MKTNIKDISLKIILVLLSVIFALTLCEVIIRVFKLAPEVHRLNPGLKKSVYKISSNPILGYEFKENYRDEFRPNLSSSYPYINSHGYRDIERTYEKSKGVKRIILLGDSVACGAEYIYDLKDTISGQLEKMLKEKRVEVLNICVNGYCTRAEVELLKMQGIRYKPDLVILLFVANDYDNLNDDLGRISMGRPKIVEKLFVSSYLFRFLCMQFNLFHMREQLGINKYAGEHINSLDKETIKKARMSNDASETMLKNHLNAIGDNNVEEGLRLLKELSVRYNFKILIGVWPIFEHDRIVDYETYNTAPYLVPEKQKLYIEQLAERNGIPSFRFSGYFRQALQEINESRKEKYYANNIFSRDTMHPTKIGAMAAAAALRSIIDSDPALLENGK